MPLNFEYKPLKILQRLSKYPLLLLLLLISGSLMAQLRGRSGGGLPSGLRNIGSRFSSTSGSSSDSLQHRDYSEDSITIYYRYLDSSRNYHLDSSISDFTRRFPVPANYVYLGNLGNAAHSLFFRPDLSPGWDPGFHAFDAYKWNLENVPVYNTTRPYTELGYELGSRTEQLIEVFHTQNIKPNWNAQFRYRFINSPGVFKSQNTNHNNYLFTSFYQGNRKRYTNYLILLANSLQSSENGGIKSDEAYLEDPIYNDRYSIPTNLGGDPQFGRNFFSSNLSTGNKYKEFTVLMRQQYDFGRSDSLVTDSTVIPLFYPRLRLEHTLMYNKYNYLFRDNVADSTYYKDVYAYTISPGDTVLLNDRWNEIVNDFSVYQFPDANNLKQFIRLGATFQNLRGRFGTDTITTRTYYNVIAHAEYRNRTRNNKWDMELYGDLYMAGLNSGNYIAHASLRRFTGRRNDNFAEVGFENINSSPSWLFNANSDFYLDTTIRQYADENTAHIYASLYHAKLKLQLSGHYYLVSNYSYFSGYFEPMQQSSLFNVLQITASKRVPVGKHWNWYIDVTLQQPTGTAPVNLPFLYIRSRFAFEGQFFRNLNISTGVEGRYYSSYNADGYAPVLGQFFYQNGWRTGNLPDIAAFLHFRIRSFKAYIRLENLNSVQFNKTGFGFTNNNVHVQGYPYPGMMLRLGVWWNFVN